MRGPGALPFHAVVHCVAFDTQGTNREVITHCMQNALTTIAGLRPHPRSVAMPVLAADNGKYELEDALRVMADILHTTQDIHLDEVWIVVKSMSLATRAQHTLEDRLGPIEVCTGPGGGSLQG